MLGEKLHFKVILNDFALGTTRPHRRHTIKDIRNLLAYPNNWHCLRSLGW